MIEHNEIIPQENEENGDVSRDWVREEIAKELLVESIADNVLREDRTQKTNGRINAAINGLRRELTETQRWLRDILLTQRAILEELGKAGICDSVVVEKRARELTDILVHPKFAHGLGVWLDRRNPSEIDKQEQKIKCAERIDICKAACCRLRFPLDVTSVTEGTLPYNKDYPFAVTRAENGYCQHLQEGECTIYDCRPLVCRTYTCQNDKRIWKEFDNKVPSEELGKWLEINE